MLKQSIRGLRPTKTKLAMLASLGVAAITLPFLAPQTVKANNDGDDSDRGGNPNQLVGTWITQVTIDPATLPIPGATLNFTRLDSFTPGGVLIASNNGPGAGGPAGQGNWTPTGHHQFAATDLRLGFDLANAFTGISKIRSTITVNKAGDEFTAVFQTDIYSPTGVLLGLHPAGTLHGVRVPIEPLN
ncbi:MAG TPA: hypothetical protein VGR78_03025 [Verrucomicrobiae bacterium]|nr:hypothetical protein [Verrucomicrobiae bacterium]